MCLFLVLLTFSPRLAAALWWIIQPHRWDTAFRSWVWPVLGIIARPWTTIMWGTVAPRGPAHGSDWIWLSFGVLFDVMAYSSQGWGGRRYQNVY